MPDRITKTQRWLDLIALLIGRTVPLTVEEIMERVPAYESAWKKEDAKSRDTVRRKFERDKDELREMGIPIESVEYRLGSGGDSLQGYRILQRDFYLPYLRVLGADEAASRVIGSPVEIAPDEATALFDSLRQIDQIPGFPMVAEARSASSKLGFDLSSDRYPGAPVLRVEPPGAGELRERMRPLSDALLAGKRVRFRYHGIHRGSMTEREVEPYGLFFQRDWYLVARDPARDAIRTFRVSRMEAVEQNTRAPKQRDYEVPAGFRLKDHVGRPAWALTDEPPFTAQVRFRFPSSLLVERNGQGEKVSEGPAGDSVRAFEVTDPNPFLRWVLGFGGEAAVLGPPELREAFREMAEQTRAAYRRRHA
jgi:proteasome accessory factor B